MPNSADRNGARSSIIGASLVGFYSEKLILTLLSRLCEDSIIDILPVSMHRCLTDLSPDEQLPKVVLIGVCTKRQTYLDEAVVDRRYVDKADVSEYRSCYTRIVMRHQPKHRFIRCPISITTINRFFSLFSYCISKERSVIATLPLRQLLRLRVLLRQLTRSSMTPRVLAAQVQRHEDAEHKAHRLEADQDGVARRESRCVGGAIDVSGDYTSNVSERDVHRHADATLGGSADVVAVPGDALGHVRVHAACDEEDADVLDGVVLAADEHDEAGEPVEIC
jgi:hypothetical protein